jgi:hypothetical protein
MADTEFEPDELIEPERGEGRGPIGKRVSFSQLSRSCGLALKYHRDRVPEGPRSVVLVFGSALHYGIEVWLEDNTRPLSVAVEAAFAYLHDAVIRADLGVDDELPIAWDAPARMTKEKRNKAGEVTEESRPYQGQEAQLETVEDCERELRHLLRTWCVLVGRKLRKVKTETELRMTFSRPAGWEWNGYLDIDHEHGIIDIKSANKPWQTKMYASKFGQAYLYIAAYRVNYGRYPERFEFHVLPKNGDDMQIVNVPIDPAAINRYIEYIVRPKIAAIEAGVYIPDLSSPFPHSERFCSWWHTCPLGAAATPEGA